MYLYLFFLIFCIKKISGDSTPLTKKRGAIKSTRISFLKGTKVFCWSLTVATPLGMLRAKLHIKLQ